MIPSQPSPAVLERISGPIVAELRREARRRAAGSVVAVCVSAAVLVGLARHRSAAPGDWVLAALLLALAAGLAAAARRTPRLAVALAAAAAFAAAVVAGGSRPLEAALGVECVATELAVGAVVVAAVWLALRGGTTSPARSAMAASAAAGALAGNAALQLTCAAGDSAPHVLAFHLGGVVLAAAVAGLAWRARTHVVPLDRA